MKHCPACNARYRGKEICQRCGLSFSQLLDVKQQAEHYQEKALAYYKTNDLEQMFISARRSYSLHQSPQRIKIYACAALLMKQYDLAFSLWRQINK